MLFKNIIGLDHIKNHLTKSADRGVVPHAQLFVGNHGSGTLPMAIAYAQYVLCQNSGGENDAETHGNLLCHKLAHPDLHFVYPVATNDVIKKHPVSSHFSTEWRTFVNNQPYGSLFDWYQEIGIEKKQGKIGVDEAQDIVKTLSLKAFEGGFKIMLIWQADKMNVDAGNKLLKLLEEPPAKTCFILIAEQEENLLQTIRSRCQVIRFPPLNEEVIENALLAHTSREKAAIFARQADGSFAQALSVLQEEAAEDPFETWFITWIRTAFSAKGNRKSIQGLLQWSNEIAATNRETQKRFLNYCIDFFRQAMLHSYSAEKLVYLQPKTKGFLLEKFAPFVHGNNIQPIVQELEEAIYHIERNGNGKMILTDLSIKLTRFLHLQDHEIEE